MIMMVIVIPVATTSSTTETAATVAVDRYGDRHRRGHLRPVAGHLQLVGAGRHPAGQRDDPAVGDAEAGATPAQRVTVRAIRVHRAHGRAALAGGRGEGVGRLAETSTDSAPGHCGHPIDHRDPTDTCGHAVDHGDAAVVVVAGDVDGDRDGGRSGAAAGHVEGVGAGRGGAGCVDDPVSGDVEDAVTTSHLYINQLINASFYFE